MAKKIKENNKIEELLDLIERYKFNVFIWCKEILKLEPALGKEELRNREFSLPTGDIIKLFDEYGYACYYDDYSIYKEFMFEEFVKDYNHLTWQQTLIYTAYQKALSTFDKPYSPDFAKYRRISVVTATGIGKTNSLTGMSLHFITCWVGSQQVMTNVGEAQIRDTFMKELFMTYGRLPDLYKQAINLTSDGMYIGERDERQRDWFLSCRVARKENPQSMAGMHSKYLMYLFDEASDIYNPIFDVVSRTLKDDENYIWICTGNPTKITGSFFENNQKSRANIWTQLQFNALESPISFKSVDTIKKAHGENSDIYRIAVLGQYPATAVTNDKGWVPLFNTDRIHFVEYDGQELIQPVLGIDPSGTGRDRTIIIARDNVYMRLILKQQITYFEDLARRIEAYKKGFNIKYQNIVIDAFGEGVKTINRLGTNENDTVVAFMGNEKLSDFNDTLYHDIKSKLAWDFYEWVSSGGIIITDNESNPDKSSKGLLTKDEWIRELRSVMYKKDTSGKIKLIPKLDFKQMYGYSPDIFDACIYTFAIKYSLENDWSNKSKLGDVFNKKLELDIKEYDNNRFKIY